MSESPPVTVVVLNWNNYEDTADCLRSLRDCEYDRCEVVVVDNGSTDGSGERIDEEFDAEVVFTGQNLGFSGGMNEGIRHALDDGAEYVVLANNDIVVPAGVVGRLVEVMESNPEVGVATPVIRLAGTDDTWFERGVVDETSGRSDHVDAPADGPVRNDYVPNCFTMVRREVFEEAGLLEERYFLYYEDVDFSIAVRRAGYELWTVTDVTIDHEGSASTDGGLGPTNTYYQARNFLLLARSDRIDPSATFPLSYLRWVVWRSIVLAYNLELASFPALFRGIGDGLRGEGGRGPYP